MHKKIFTFPSISLIAPLVLTVMLIMPNAGLGAGATTYPWPSFRHDLLNTGAAPDSGYPTTAIILWKVDRTDRPDVSGEPAGSMGPVVVDEGMVFTAGTGIVQANDQFTGDLIWSKAVPYDTTTVSEPADAPTDWCYNDIPTPALKGNTGVCYVADMVDCPSWCFECTTEEPECPSLINPLSFLDGYGQSLGGPTLNPSYGDNGCVIFGTFDGRVISLDMSDGEVIWEKTPYKDPGGPNEDAPWYDQKFAWHLSPPSIADGKVYIGSFLPSFYYTRSASTHYWVGRDGYFYALNESDGSIFWTWTSQLWESTRGSGVTNIPPVHNGKVFIEADAVSYGQFATLDATTGEELWKIDNVRESQGGSQPISGDIIFSPGGDGSLWALDVNTGQVKWTYHGGFNDKGFTGLTASPALDETRGWVIGASDTGHLFVLNKDTGQVVREAFLGVSGWNAGDPHPDSGYWFPGPSGIAIVPSQTLLYVAGTDSDRAWQGESSSGKEKLFCYDYGSGDTLTLLWEYQFCRDNDVCATDNDEYLVKGRDPYMADWYSIGSPALADGHVYYASNNGKIYGFGAPYCPVILTLEEDSQKINLLRDFRDEVLLKQSGGEDYVRAFYQHASEVSSLLIKNPDLIIQAQNLVTESIPIFKSLLAGKKTVISSNLVTKIVDLLTNIESQASPSLKKAIKKIERDIRGGEMWRRNGVISKYETTEF